jgi:putative endonuclease
MKQNEWVVYMIQTDDGKLYTGITNNLDKRFNDHLNSKKGAKFFRFSNPEKIIFHESHPNRSEAQKREIMIKKMDRTQKLALIHEKS